MKPSIMRASALAAALLLPFTLTSCSGDIDYVYTPTGVVAQVNSIVLTVGTQTVTVYKDGKITLGPLAFVRPNTAITATLMDNADKPITNVTGAQAVVNMGIEASAPLAGTTTFTRTGPFAGTIAATAAGNSSFAVSLFDPVAHRIVFGPYYVGLLVR